MIFILRMSFLFLLYLFLFWISLLVWRELRLSQREKKIGEEAVFELQGQLVLEKSPVIARRKNFFLGKEFTIGRSTENELSLKDEALSSKHALIIKTKDGFLIKDLNSTNGTFVNGQKISAPFTLKSGDEIRLGRCQLRFKEER